MSQARKPLTEEVLTRVYAALLARFGVQTKDSWEKLPKADRDDELARLALAEDRGARFAGPLVYAAIAKGPLEADTGAAIRKAAVAYRVGFITYDTFLAVLDTQLGRVTGTNSDVVTKPKWGRTAAIA